MTKWLAILGCAVFILPSALRAETDETLELLDLFGDVFEKIREEYVEEPADKDLIESAINGMLTSLDPHSSFLNKKAFGEMQVQTKGEFGGLGIEVTMKNGMVYIVSPIDDTPAFEAGLQAEDYISHIDGESVMGLTISEAVAKMRGKPGTSIKLTILRKEEEEPFDVEIVRDIIQIRSVRSHREGDVIYLRVTNFTEQSSPLAEEHIEKLREEIGEENLQGLVLDLRNNPGGLLTQAIAISDMFLDRGEIVSTRGREARSTQRFNAEIGDILNGLPMVVLINSGSASASEIVAGALQDHRRALVVGTKSFGKGSVQTVIPLAGETAMRLTTSRYYTPSGRSIQAKGIDPDIIVEQANLEFVKKRERNTEAKLPGHLSNPKEGEEKTDKSADDTVEESLESDEKTDKEEQSSKDITKYPGEEAEEEEKTLYETDYQLARALDLLRGVYIYEKRDRVNK